MSRVGCQREAPTHQSRLFCISSCFVLFYFVIFSPHTHTHTNAHRDRIDWCMAAKPVSSITKKKLSPTYLHRICSKSPERCDNGKLVRIPRHGTVPRTVHLLDVLWVSLRATGWVPIRAETPALLGRLQVCHHVWWCTAVKSNIGNFYLFLHLNKSGLINTKYIKNVFILKLKFPE